jgi:uncharacterized protein YjbJ (UPF0337 family)
MHHSPYGVFEMNKDKGKAKKVVSKTQPAVSKTPGSSKQYGEGAAKQSEGKYQDKASDIKSTDKDYRGNR